ncbi:MAG: hypothetical protein HYR63_23250 [Proteobacteria bacterium]|nr:hypothetical protein [Pseudomonadota bacterium]MBI3498283.1 hypothetical protein [Pseudomonadota bacterium]
MTASRPSTVGSGQATEAELVHPDRLHMSQWGYRCLARQLVGAIEAALG